MTNKAISDPLQKDGNKQDSEKVAPVKEKNYTEAQEELLNSVYPANPTRETVDQLAKELGKAPRSVIAKLSSMKIYITPPRTTKSGAPIIKKETLVAHIGALLEVEMPSLVKANKADLEKLLSAVEEWTGSIEDDVHSVV